MKLDRARACLGLLITTLAVQPACRKEDRPVLPLTSPTSQALEAANQFKVQLPGARVFFSQRSGEILWVDGAGKALATGPAPQTAAQALSTVQGFLSSHPNLYRVSNPNAALQAQATELRLTGASNGVLSLRFEQTQSGIAIAGKYGMALFDPSGNLLALETRLLPTEQFQKDPSQGETTNSTTQGLTLDRRDLQTRILAPTATRQIWGRLEGSPGYRILEERVERGSDGTVTRTLRDPSSGETLQTTDETPSDLVAAPTSWAQQGTYSITTAHSTLGQSLQIPSTQLNQTWVMGFHLAGIHADGQAVIIGDSGSLDDHSRINTQPIATRSSDWTADTQYDSKLRAASTLASHLQTTLDWFQSEHGHSSWNGAGATLYAAIRVHKSADPKPELNSWGGNGLVLIGDGTTATGQPESDALDIVAHEFTHSVIDATASFEYHDESGALNESLADIFGKSVEGWPNSIEGQAAGARFRDLAHPDNCGTGCNQPAFYGEYAIMNEDHAGVHTNSGIMNHALSEVVLKKGQEQANARGIALSGLILDAMKQVSFATDSALEEFAAALTAYCKIREQAHTLLPTQSGYCQDLENAFQNNELLTRP